MDDRKIRAQLEGYSSVNEPLIFDALVATVARMLAEQRIDCAERVAQWAGRVLYGSETSATFNDLLKVIRGDG